MKRVLLGGLKTLALPRWWLSNRAAFMLDAANSGFEAKLSLTVGNLRKSAIQESRSMSKCCSARRLIAAFLVVAINTPTPAKDGKELPIQGGMILMFVPGQSKFLMQGGRTMRPERGIYGFAVVNAGDGKVIGVIQRDLRKNPQVSPDGASFMTLSEKSDKIELWQTSTVKPRKELDVLKSPSDVAFSPDGKFLAVVGHIDDFGAPLALKAVDLPSGKERWVMPLAKTDSDRGTAQLATSKSGELLVAQSGVWKLVDFQTGKVQAAFEGRVSRETEFSSGGLHLSHDARRFVHVTRAFVNVWEVDGRKRLFTLPDKYTPAYTPAKFVSGDDRHSDILVIGSRDGLVGMLNISTLKLTEFGDKHEATITDIDASATKRIAVTASEDFRIKVWDLETAQLIETLVADKSAVRTIAISSDGERIASCYENGSVRIWNLK